MTRRQLLAALSTTPALLHAKTVKTLGVQLYTVREAIKQNTAEVIKGLAQIGYKEFEATWGDLNKVWPSLQQTSMKPVSLHLDTAMFFRDQAKLPAAIAEAKAKGFQYVVCPYVAKEDRGGADTMKKLGDTLNKAGEIARKNGLRLAYHNHAFEFAPSGEVGSLFDVLMRAADPKLVSLELDIMWAQVAGVDPAAIIKAFGNRVTLLHLKDVAKGEPRRLDESIPKSSFKEAGTGSVDFASVLRAAEAAGVRHCFVEQDQTPGDPLASLRQSYEYLSKLNY